MITRHQNIHRPRPVLHRHTIHPTVKAIIQTTHPTTSHHRSMSGGTHEKAVVLPHNLRNRQAHTSEIRHQNTMLFRHKAAIG